MRCHCRVSATQEMGQRRRNPKGAGVCAAWPRWTSSTWHRIEFVGRATTRRRRSPREAPQDFFSKPLEVAAYENAAWSRAASSYDRGFGRLVKEALPALLTGVAAGPGDRVLDLGSGTGLAAAAAARLGAEVVGVDFSPVMVAVAEQSHQGIDFRVGSVEELPFEEQVFDVAIANFALHHSGAPESVLREVHRVLAPGGRLGFTVWAEPEALEAFGLFFAAVEKHAGAVELPHGPLFGVSDPDALESLVDDAGFGAVAVRRLSLSWRTGSLDPYLAAFRDWADLGRLPLEGQKRIEEAVRRGAEAYRTDHGFEMPNPAVLVIGVN